MATDVLPRCPRCPRCGCDSEGKPCETRLPATPRNPPARNVHFLAHQNDDCRRDIPGGSWEELAS